MSSIVYLIASTSIGHTIFGSTSHKLTAMNLWITLSIRHPLHALVIEEYEHQQDGSLYQLTTYDWWKPLLPLTREEIRAREEINRQITRITDIQVPSYTAEDQTRILERGHF